MTQEDILTCEWDDLNRMYEVRDMLPSSPELHFHLFLENPLENGYYLFSIIDKGNYSTIIVKNYIRNMD